MFKFSRGRDTVDTEIYEKHLRYNGRILVDKERLKKRYDYETLRKDSLAVFAKDVMIHRSSGRCRDLSRNSIYNYLTSFEGCPDRYFYTRKSDNFSIEMNHVLQPLYKNGYAQEFLKLYMEHSSKKSKCGSISSILAACREPFCYRENGDPLYQLLYTVNKQTNLRYNYKNFDIVSQLPKEYTDAITVEDGYFLAWGDFAQSDLRIAYNLLLRNEDNFEIMCKTEDKYEGIARLIARMNNEVFDLEAFKEQRDLYKVYVLETIYGTRNTTIQNVRPFILALSKYLETCDKYTNYVARIDKKISMNLPVVTTGYFGYEQIAPSFLARDTDIRNFALNSPIQTGTSEIIILTVNKILDKFYSLGYTPEDVSVYIVRHDEPVFKVSKRALKDAWIFHDASVIQIDDWIPLKLDFSYGYYYGEEDEDLSLAVKNSAIINADKIISYAPDKYFMSKQYYPISDTADISYHLSTLNNSTIIAFYDDKLQATYFSEICSLNDKAVEATTVAIVKKLARLYSSNGYNGMSVRSNFLNGDIYSDGNLIKFKRESNAKLYTAQLLSEYATNKLAAMRGIEKPYRDRADELKAYNLRLLTNVLH